MLNTIKRFWALCLDTRMKLALYKYAIIIIINGSPLKLVKKSVGWNSA